MSRVSRREREIEIAGLVRDGLGREGIAERLGLTVGYVGEVCNRLGLDGAKPLPAPKSGTRPDGVHLGVPDHEYHADIAALSSSGARLLLPPSAPELFRHKLDAERKPKREFDFGQIAHRLLLGDGARFEVLHPEVVALKADGSVAANPRATAGWKQAEQDARDAGRVPVHADDFARAEAMVSAVRRHPDAGPLFADGVAELSLFATDPETGVRLRARPDWTIGYHGTPTLFVDFKTTVCAEPNEFARKGSGFGYHIQAAFYLRVARLVDMDVGMDVRFLFVACEKTPPHMVSVVEFDRDDLAAADQLVTQAIQVFAECSRSGQWPGYPPGIHTMRVPPWLLPGTDMTAAAAAAELINELEELTA
ncbi:MAG TPA: PD-(D/E)XK nuclease-like domain-containing protein [Mycolicibacterium fallax]|nr:PD-(D/E)XK nuclease-like domain-containing protein [Mycolicibacterium fallax]